MTGPDDTQSPEENQDTPRKRQAAAAAIGFEPERDQRPRVIASGKGALADKILELAFANGIRVREDPVLAEMLAGVTVDCEIPTDALLAVAEVLARVYDANTKMAEKPEMP